MGIRPRVRGGPRGRGDGLCGSGVRSCRPGPTPPRIPRHAAQVFTSGVSSGSMGPVGVGGAPSGSSTDQGAVSAAATICESTGAARPSQLAS
eukprot:9108127-Alexandrium_andersonii.AAC.1